MAQGYARREGSAASLTPIYGDILAGIIDGVNVFFTLTSAPVGDVARLYYNGQALHPADYLISGTSVTLSWAPESGTLMADYFV